MDNLKDLIWNDEDDNLMVAEPSSIDFDNDYQCGTGDGKWSNASPLFCNEYPFPRGYCFN